MSEQQDSTKGRIGAQLFTDLKDILALRFSKEKLSRIKKRTQLPDEFHPLFYVLSYAKTFNDPAMLKIAETYLDLSVSIDGIGREEALQLESILHGIQAKIDKTPPPPPNLLDKIVNSETNKEYQEYQQWKELRELDKSG